MYEIDFQVDDNRRLGTILQLQAAHNGDTPFLLFGDQHYSFSDTNTLVNRYVSGLREIGVTPGDRIAIYLHGCVEFVLLALAAHKLGAVWVPINTDYKGDWLAETLGDSCAALLVTDDDLLPRVLEVDDRVSYGQRMLRQDLGAFAKLPATEPDMAHIHYGDTCAILWTSGTTGKSKGVMQNHNVWVRAAIHNNRNFEIRPGDVAYNCLPLYNSAAWVANIYRALVGGIGCAIDPAFSVGDFWDRMRHYGATQTMTLGAMHMFLWNQPARDDDADNPLRTANMVPMPEPLMKPFCERFGIEGNLQGFGQSEAMLLMSRKDIAEKQWPANALGEVAQGIELRLLDEEGADVAVGESGEFCVRETKPHQIFNGYFNNPQAQAGAYTGEWYHTGDLGRQDADGNYFFVDRKKDVIRFKGRNVSSVQIEGIALQHPAVVGAAAYAVKADELDSEDEIKLDVIIAEGAELQPQELARHVNDHAPYFYVPRYIEMVAELPYTPTNKVQKYKLRDQPVTSTARDRMQTNFELER